jgi:DNA polymerase/3'-5' exonuclease PolX
MFKFDPNSTKNEGRWRLIDPEEFEKKKIWSKKDKDYDGIRYIVGILKLDGTVGIQAIRFNKNYWSEQEAKIWWGKHKDLYVKTWTEKTWEKWIKTRKDFKKDPNRTYIARRKGLSIARKIINKLDLIYVNPTEVSIDYSWKKNIGIPVGSLRRGNQEIGDVDIIITKSIDKKIIQEKLELEKISGGDKRIDFIYDQTSINIFIFLDSDTWGASLLHSTGPFSYNIRIRNKVKKEGGKLSQKGLEIDGKIIKTSTERILQKKLGINERKPNER